MNGNWQKMKTKEILEVESLLRAEEKKSVTACGRFLSRIPSRDSVWTLREKKGALLGLLINSRSTIIPVLSGRKEIPAARFLKGLLRTRKVHSVQGLLEEVNVLEDLLKQMGANIVEIFDYDLMSLDKMPEMGKKPPLSNLILRPPRLTDLDAAAALQTAYEHEEVLHKGSNFSPVASRINITNIIASGKILAAELNGKLVGKINVNAVSFTRYQVGGVYVHPDFRGMGIARRMAGEFISSLVKEGRGVTLFVKKNNTAARRLYAGLGFVTKGDYRITYY